MCSNPYQLLKLDLFEDQKQFERTLETIYERQKVKKLQSRHRIEKDDIISRYSDQQKVLRLKYALRVVEERMRCCQQVAMDKMVSYEVRGKKESGLVWAEDRREKGAKLIVKILHKQRIKTLKYALDYFIRQKALRTELIKKFSFLQNLIKTKYLSYGFRTLHTNYYQKLILEQKHHISSLKTQIDQFKKINQTESNISSSNANTITQLKEQLKAKETNILKLQKQLKFQKHQYQQQVQQLQDELNRLNLQNIKLKAREEQEYQIEGGINRIDRNQLFDESADLSLRILDQIEFGGSEKEKEKVDERIEERKTEEELSEKYFKKIVELKEIIEIASDFIEQNSGQGLNQQQTAQVLRLLQFK